MILLMMEQAHLHTKTSVSDGDIQKIASPNGLDALRSLYERIHPAVYGYALSLTKNTHDAEDVLQETFLSIHRAASNYQPCGKPMAWILTIAKNHARMKLRERNREEALPESPAEDPAAFQQIQNLEARAVLLAALKALTDEERQIVTLHCVSGLKNREIATLMGLPLNTVLSKYHRALKKLKTLLKEEDFYA